jgi:hypothetical protein
MGQNAAVHWSARLYGGPATRVCCRYLLLVVLATALAGCGVHGGQGPLSEGDGSATSCFPKGGGARFILGSDSLINTGKGPVTIDSVELTDAVNLVESGAFVAPVPSHGPSTLMGEVTGAPWRFYDKSQKPLWRLRTPAQNAVVQPTSLGSDLNLLFVTSAPTANKDSTAGIEVRYHDGAKHSYVWHSIVTYRAVPRPSC